MICLSVIKSGKSASVVFLFCKFLMGLLLPFTAYAYQRLVDDIIRAYSSKSGMEFFITSLLFVILIYIFQAVEEPVENYVAFLIRQRINYLFDKKIANKLKDTEYSYFENSDNLDLINRVESASGNSAVDLFINVIDFLSGIIKIIGVMFLLTTYSYLIAITVAVIAVPIFWLASKYGKQIHDWYQKNSQSRRFLGYLSSLFTDKTTSFEIKEYDFYAHLKAKWKTRFKDLRKRDFNVQLKAWKNTVISSFLLNIFEYVTYAVMLIPAISGVITIGTFIGLSKAISSIEGLILWNFSSVFAFFAENKEYWKEYHMLMDFEEVKKATSSESPNDNMDGISIEFKDVYFRYANMDHDVLTGVSFKINACELCGFVGINGAGKSTITKLLLGLYRPNRGDIYINGKNTKEMSFDEQVSYFGVTYQDFNKYNMSIKDNIAISNQAKCNDNKIEACLKDLAFDYSKLPNQIETVVGRLFGNGIDISGGEAQKLAIARMLYSNAPCYIMDEPTASLDPISEVQLYEQICSALSQKTALMITHRLGATAFCSKILVLSGGKIVEDGTFNELLERGGYMQKCITNSDNGIINRLKLLLRTVSSIFKSAPLVFCVVLISELLIGLLQTLTLIAWQHVVNNVEKYILKQTSLEILLLSLAISLLIFIFMDLFRMVLESFYTLLNSKTSERLEEQLYDKCKKINVVYFENSDLYNQIDRAKNAISWICSLSSIIGIFVMAFGRIGTLSTYVLWSKPVFALIVVLPIIPILVTRIVRGRDLYRLNFIQSEKRRECGYYKGCINNKETRTLRAVPFFWKKWDGLYCDICSEEKKVNKKLVVVFLAMNLMKYSVYILAIYIAAIYLFDGSIDIGMFALITGMLGTTHATIEVVVSRSGDIAGSLKYANDYFMFLDKPVDIETDKVLFDTDVELKDVCFSYPNADHVAVNHISLKIKHGEKIALIGVNGAGKSTLAKIIAGLYNPSSGTVIYNNKLRPDNVMIDCAMVFQNFCKYYLTLRENVAFGKISTLDNDQELNSALAWFDFDLSKANNSLDTQLGRNFNGVELSGGEWQKIALSRGFIRESNLVLLDEPNSGLDPLTESKVLKTFLELLKDKTGIIITHRVGIASLADRVILMENGEILENGTHDELMKLEGQYKKLYLTQANMYR